MARSRKQQARFAGFLYLLMGITGAFGLMYMPSKIVVNNDPTATSANIINHDFLFRAGIISQLTCQVIFVFLVLALYHLLKAVNKKNAQLMVALVLVAVPMAFLNELTHVAALVFQSDAGFLHAFEPDQLNAWTMVSLNLYDWGIGIVQIFWGLWLLPLGLLVYQSGFIPRIFGILLIVGCIGYLMQSVTILLFPNAVDFVSNITSITGLLGEIPILAWLLIMGIRSPEPVPQATTQIEKFA